MTLQIILALAPLVFTVFAVAGIGDTFTRYTKSEKNPDGKRLDTKIMATMPSGIGIIYFFVTWILGLYSFVPIFPSWKGFLAVFIAGLFVGVVNNFAYDKFLFKIFSKENTDKIADGLAEKVVEKVTGEDQDTKK